MYHLISVREPREYIQQIGCICSDISKTLKYNLSKLIVIFYLTVTNTDTYFPTSKEAVLVDAGALYGD